MTRISLFCCWEMLLVLMNICMDDWEKSNETSLPEKQDFYSHLNMEDITDADYAHVKSDKLLFKEINYC